MLLHAVQKLVRLVPGATRVIWERMPASAREALSSVFYPIAAGPRSSGFVLEVPTDLVRRGYDVVLANAAPLEGHAADWLAAERSAGRRLVVAGEGRLSAQLAEAGVTDGVYVADPTDPVERLEEARRHGLRVVDRSSPSQLVAPFPRVSIVIPTHDGGPLVSACLRALLRNTPWPGLEIIVVDNGSHDATRLLLSTHAQRDGVFVLMNATNKGFAVATNQGLRRAAGDFVVLLNDDTVVGPGWLSRLVAHLESEPNLGLVCPVTNEIGNDAKIDVDYGTFDEMEAFAHRRLFEHAGERRPIETVALFCAAARRATLERIGFLDERYVIGMFEDDDLSRTLGARGLSRAIADDACVHHVGQASFGKLSDAEYLAIWQSNRKRFEDKWGVRWIPPAATKRA
jgi:GT2 family glycosyltransferase